MLLGIVLAAGACGGVSATKTDGGPTGGADGRVDMGAISDAATKDTATGDAATNDVASGDTASSDTAMEGGALDAADAGGGDATDAGSLSGSLDVCVLDAPPPTGKCAKLAALDFGSHSPGMPLMRLFRVDNGTAADVVFDSVTIASAQFTVTTVRYEPDPGNAGAYLRVPQALPATRPSGTSLYFEVAYTTGTTPGPLPANEVDIATHPNPADAGNLVVPMFGTIIACPTDTAACDSNPSNGCETDLTTDVMNCGACTTSCAAKFPQSQVSCVSRACQFLGCLAGHWDINKDPTDGCEYACTPQAGPDLPDDNFADTNCDGIDGDVALALFVATSGSDSNPGTMALPLATINGALAKAMAAGKTQIYISSGVYEGRVTLGNGISLYGGYSQANGWKRSAAYTTTISSTTAAAGRVSGVEGVDITSATTIDRLTIQAGDAAAPGTSSYAMTCARCPAVTVSNSVLVAGKGAPGTKGADGTPGMPGANGTAGGDGTCDGSNPGLGGPGGVRVCDATTDVSGGSGGPGGPEGANSGAMGQPGKNGGGPAGPGGTGGDPGGPGTNGGPGAAVGAGTAGLGGMLGMVTGGFWFGAPGGDGLPGAHGRGGGGGGGGGGQGCTFCNDGSGNGGGGGGSGGCAGGAGHGGTAGGGSFGLFLVDSTGFVLAACTVSTANGGDGGGGGDGGSGGVQGSGQPGGQACTNEVGGGGGGGSGSKGGDGGGGGGGAGGPSYAVYRLNTTLGTAGNSLTSQSGGVGGPGGAPNGGTGTTGASAQVF